jgi:ubiquinol-cytochrome c reductase cytochrome b subunit
MRHAGGSSAALPGPPAREGTARGVIGRLYAWLDDQIAFSRGGRKVLDYVFPDHWSFMLGEIALYSFAVLVATGIFLTLYFVPSNHDIVYHGLYAPLQGAVVPESYASAVDLSFVVRAGLLVRQTHHWAADVFLGAISIHMARVYFTSAYRRPRQLNWLVGSSLLALAMVNGYLGYSLPDDLMAGQGVRIGYSILESIPVVGQYLAVWIWGGQFGASSYEYRFFIAHCLIVPLLIMGLIAVHLALIIRPHHTQFPGKDRKEKNVVGTPMWPGYAAKSQGFFLLTTGVLLLLGGLVEIDPFWSYGPYLPFRATDASQPDWYLGWLEGIMRLFPAWEIHLPGHMIPEQFWSAVATPLVAFGVFYTLPFAMARLTGDRSEHHLLDHPRDRPLHTAFGCAFFSFLFVMFVGASDDVISAWMKVTLEDVVWFCRIGLLVVPAVTFLVTYKLCKELQHRPAVPLAVRRTVLVARRDDGSYTVAQVVPPDGAARHPEETPLEVG